MKLEQVAEVGWQLYEGGRPSATNQTLEQDDFYQLVYIEVAYQLKMQFYQSRKDNDGEKSDFYAGMLSSRQYDLGDTNYMGKRSAFFKEDVIRLPRNCDITNVYMVAENCDGTVNGEIVQVQPSEENFYINDFDLKFSKFYVQKSGRLDTYNIPSCVNKIEVERIYATDDLDIPLDMAHEVLTNIWNVTLKVRGFVPTEDNPSDGNRNQIRYQLEQQDKKI